MRSSSLVCCLALCGLLLMGCSARRGLRRLSPSDNHLSPAASLVGGRPAYSFDLLRCGAERMELLLPLLQGRRVALFVNQSSVVGPAHVSLVDTLLSCGVEVTKIFVPEHGFRGDYDAGAAVAHDKDERTGLRIVSLYSNRRKPAAKDLRDVDVLVFDMQDVGCRFYTYISSMHYAMEAAAEHDVEMIVCDRPNPNDYVDGPIRQPNCRSFVGVDPLPILHGLTIGELAQMINGEGWLGENLSCRLTVIPMQGWRHGDPYSPPIPPSPNLKSDAAIKLYPSICFFEATIMSVGRGTDCPFELLGYPERHFGTFTFVPEPVEGASKPLYSGQICYGIDLVAHLRSEESDYLPRNFDGGLTLKPLLQAYRIAKEQNLKLINRKRIFELLVGNKTLIRQMDEGLSEEEIRATWQEDLAQYRKIRERYLLYPAKEMQETILSVREVEYRTK